MVELFIYQGEMITDKMQLAPISSDIYIPEFNLILEANGM